MEYMEVPRNCHNFLLRSLRSGSGRRVVGSGARGVLTYVSILVHSSCRTRSTAPYLLVARSSPRVVASLTSASRRSWGTMDRPTASSARSSSSQLPFRTWYRQKRHTRTPVRFLMRSRRTTSRCRHRKLHDADRTRRTLPCRTPRSSW